VSTCSFFVQTCSAVSFQETPRATGRSHKL
jgi:hypothetical protein